MAFDKTKPFGTSLGGETHGFKVQNDRIYDHADNEVDSSGKPVARKPAPKSVKVPAASAEKTPAQLEAEAEVARQAAVQ